MPTQIEVFVPDNLAIELETLDRSIREKAQQNLDVVLREYDDAAFTQMQKRAMLIGEELKLVNDLDFTSVLLRAKRLIQIRDEALYSVHPNEFNTLEQIAVEVGISTVIQLHA